MALREEDLKDTVLKKISLDEFEPKTGKEEDVAVIGFYLNSEESGKDLYNFLGSSIIEHRDIEVSPNPNDEGYYMVFAELDRGENLLNDITGIVAEVERVSGKLVWEVKTPYIDEYVALAEVEKFIQVDPAKYLSASDMKDSLEADLKQELDKQEDDKANDIKKEAVLEFLFDSNLTNAMFNEDGQLSMQDARGKLNLEFINFGNGTEIMQELGISESAINLDPDRFVFDKLNSMLGEMKALPIDNYVVIFNPKDTDIIVARTC